MNYCNKIILYEFLHRRMVLSPDQIALWYNFDMDYI